MKAKTASAACAALVSLALISCSKAPETGPASSPGTTAGAPTPSSDTCRDFPVALYPRTTSAICEVVEQREGNPLHHTAYLKSADSVEQVTQYFQAQNQPGGWTPEPPAIALFIVYARLAETNNTAIHGSTERANAPKCVIARPLLSGRGPH